MVNSRTKGHNFERHIVNLINKYLKSQNIDQRVNRNLDQQMYAGQADIYWDNFAIECKRYNKNASIMFKQDWWDQVCVSAGDDLLPILIYKYDRRPIYLAMPIYLMSGRQKANNDAIYMCSLKSMCKDFKTIMQNASVYNT